MAAKTKVNHRKIWIVVYLLTMFILGIVIYVFPTVTDAFTRTYIVEYGGIQASSEVEGYVIRQENVYVANRSGVIQYYAEEGKKLRKGAKVLDIVSGDAGYTETKYTSLMEHLGDAGQELDSYTARGNGTVSYHLDGYEEKFTPDKLDTLTHEKIKSMEIKVENVTRNSTLKGEPLYKISDNNLWYLVCWVGEKELSQFKVDTDNPKTVTVSMPQGDISATIKSVKQDGDAWKVVLESNEYCKDLSQLRKVNVTIVTEDDKGLVIPNESITSVKSELGVYVKDIGGDYVFKPVKVITSDGEYSLIKESYFYKNDGKDKVETVDVYDEILRSGKP